MTAVIQPADTIGQALRNTLEAVNALGGKAVNTLTTLTAPGAEDQASRSALDRVLHERGDQSIQTVANTLFPVKMYRSPGAIWSPSDKAGERDLDAAADSLYGGYIDMLPLLRSANGNSRGTYFERMIRWPSVKSTEFNQLAERIRSLRLASGKHHASNHVQDIAVAFDSHEEVTTAGGSGLQVYASDDRRPLGFPCLVHIDLSVFNGHLNMLAVYRNWHLVTKGYGNMLGLSRLLAFLSEQTGYPVGELAIVAGHADCQQGKTKTSALVNALHCVDLV